MARYTGPSWKVSRRLGISLSGTGKELERRPYAPGQHGPTQRKKISEYGLQQAEKQKLRHGRKENKTGAVVNHVIFTARFNTHRSLSAGSPPTASRPAGESRLGSLLPTA